MGVYVSCLGEHLPYAAGGAVVVRILRDGKPAFIAVPAAQA